jgi:hypothetical protein
MIISEEKFIENVLACESMLFIDDKIPYSLDKNWTSKYNFPSESGLYAIFDISQLVYLGETADIKERMKDVRRTINHTFRRKLGKKLFSNAVIEKGKFNANIEKKLDEFCVNNIKISYVEVNYGRLEIESYLIHKYKAKGLLNSIGKRNKIHLL